MEYQKFPEYFDSRGVSSVEDFDIHNAVFEKLLRSYKSREVLDLTCGTGSQVLYLAKHGYEVVGSDFSPELLKIARRKAEKDGLEIKFIDGDMRTSSLGTFDACITMFNAVGHLTKSDFAKAMRNILSNLREGGIYMFDIFNLSAMTDKVVRGFAYQAHKFAGNVQILQSQVSCLDRKTGLLTSFDNYTAQDGVDKPQIFSNEFTLQIYSANELEKMLLENGFRYISRYALDGGEFIESEAVSMIIMAQK